MLTHPFIVDSDHCRLRIPSRADSIEETVQFLTRRAVACGLCDQKGAFKVSLALHEAITNAIVHGNLEISSDLKELGGTVFAETMFRRSQDPYFGSREVEVAIDFDGTRCIWTLTDHGKGFNVASVLRKAEEAESPSPSTDDVDCLLASGRGILIMRSFMDEVRFEEEGRRCVMVLNRDVSESPTSKKRAPGIECQQPIRIIPLRDPKHVDWDQSFSALAMHISPEGVLVQSPQLLQEDTALVEIPARHGNVYFPVRICHKYTGSNGLLRIRFRFDWEMDAPQVANPHALCPDKGEREVHLQGVLDDLKHDPCLAAESFASGRDLFTERIAIVNVETDLPHYVYARNATRSGISFLSEFSYPLGRIEVRLPQLNDRWLSQKGCVEECNRIANGPFYEVTVRFMSE